MIFYIVAIATLFVEVVMCRIFTLLIVSVLFSAVSCFGETFTVDDDGPADFSTINDAINYAWHGDTVEVQPGTYNESVYYNGLAIKITSSDPTNPEIVATTIINVGQGIDAVVFDFLEDNDSVLTGFTVTGKRGIYCNNTSPTIIGNVIKNCVDGGIIGCGGPIEGNQILNNGNANLGYGGGLYDCDGPIQNNVISGNIVQRNGGGLCRCDGPIQDNIISGNITFYNGISYGGAGLYDCDGLIQNNIISGNIAGNVGVGGGSGGGLCLCRGTIQNNTIVGNRANRGGGIYDCYAYVKNNIIAFNKAADANGGGVYNCSQTSYNVFWENDGGNFGGSSYGKEGDFFRNPLFAVDGYWDEKGTPEDITDDVWHDGDYHLKSGAGRWDGDAWVLDDQTSRCIDMGDLDSDVLYEPGPNGDRINLGAYGGTSLASKSLLGVGNPEVHCVSYPRSDANEDCKVDLLDLTILAAEWMMCNLEPVSACAD
ncbi:MAG: hypothetical protein JEZ07_18725 [Phycisphaerae bacterium]|nr:hypothetical protein [Phycisphaerae bacterium]